MTLVKCILFSCCLLLSIAVLAQKDHWEAYIAQYEKGAGSTLVNMSLKEKAPDKQYPFLLKAGVRLIDCTAEGLPGKDDWDALYAISDKIKAAVNSLTPNIQAGTFSYQCDRMDYYYVKDTAHARAILSSVFKTSFPKYEYKIEIRSDPSWEAYLTFLYPNEETMEFMENEKVVMNLKKEGDHLNKPRQVDHWLYFNTAAERDAFVTYALHEKFKLEGKEYKQKSKLPFQLHISRIDKVDMDSITAVTLALRTKAKELHGDYDGWETFVVKD
ncbi:DUF695 domain-containing protein [Puia dinghuensis]|uniref:DUF695 domain-containing protein n=1 Tax=Puia dinghuensis TaxID=1792502 RepID=A0A8J2XUD3_9BACT|nr:DUF695 domain-containing protein [Puia dinghuensis]GGB11407.1 hypothetical protein GCM10011511_38750 [Puia dinghuensis]